MSDKYSATWVSNSSISDFLKCPRAYFLKNVYKRENGAKIMITSPALSLGSAVHNTVEALAKIPAAERFNNPEHILQSFDQEWKKVSGEIGGFENGEEERAYYERGKKMLEQIVVDPKILSDKRVIIPDTPNGMLPNFYLSEEENIILCGKIDWLRYRVVDGQQVIDIYDFKTSRGGREENDESLQLPIYQLLLSQYTTRLRQEQPNKKAWWQDNFKVAKAFYWYLETGEIKEKELLPERDAFEMVFAKAQQVNNKRQLLNVKIAEYAQKNGDRWRAKEQVIAEESKNKTIFTCLHGDRGCFACRDLEKILQGEAKFVGMQYYDENDKKGTELYLVKQSK